ncbi:hypothetical protein H5410_010125 [Solanum commersonii]|uniref:Protein DETOXIFICATION n=1 Tax=Solanum commersonii TaxID=4109 RepID=A0A9J6AKS3_SOLCO|nr:hypothetical protein H5410_010125 [Solanum commersonii]
MNLQTLIYKSHIPNQFPKMNMNFSSTRLQNCQIPVKLENLNPDSCISDEQQVKAVTVGEEIPLVNSNGKEEFSGNENIWDQMVEIVKFSGPAVGLWLCGPLMSLIDTAVVGQGSSIEFAALVATALAKQDKDGVQHQISILLFIGLACGVVMLIFTGLFGTWGITAFTGAHNTEITNAVNTYVQIRGLAWPAMLVGWVAQSASLGIKDSWGPLKALAVATAINGIGDIVLCRFFNYGIAGAAWATMVSQVVAAYMMIAALSKNGYNGLALSVPSLDELLQIFMLAAPVFLTMMSKVAFYSLLVYYATSMGTHTAAAHQMNTVNQARMLLKLLLIIGASNGLIMGTAGVLMSLFFSKIFSTDPLVIQEMHNVLLPLFLALLVAPSVLCLEGTLLAGRDFKFLSISVTSIFGLASLLVMLFSSKGFGLSGCWFALVAFQWTRLLVALRRLTMVDGMLYLEGSVHDEFQKLKVS